MFFRWLQGHAPLDKGFAKSIFDRVIPPFQLGLLATTASLGLLGAAHRWFRTPNRVRAEEMAARIETMVSPVLFGTSQ